MTSKELLEHIKNAPAIKGGDTRYTNTSNSSSLYDKDIEQIKTDLEVLEILKKHLYIKIDKRPTFDGNYCVALQEEEEQYCYYTCIFVNEEEKEKIKEWLGNEITKNELEK